jgi:hypothetical protein
MKSTSPDLLMQTWHHGLPVLNADGELVGIFTVQDRERVQSDKDNGICLCVPGGRSAQGHRSSEQST